MKTKLSLLLCLILLAMAPAAMAEGLEIDGVIEAGRTPTITAPFTGTVGDFDVQAGDVLAAGDVLFPLSVTTVYAETDGTVTGLFALPGDSAATVIDRFGALGYVERDELFSAACSTAGADGDTEDKIVHPGETVYLKSTQNSDRRGEGRVTSVSGSSYTVEITDEGSLRINESFKVYRDKGHDADSCIGSGRTSRVDPVAVTAEGYVLAVHVTDGQRVSRGDALFSVVPDQLTGMQGGEAAALMPQDGVLLSVSAQSGAQAAKDSVLATYCPVGGMELQCPVDEMDLADIAVGASVSVTLDAYPDAPVSGEIVKIAAAADENGEFAVTIALEASENVRIGMSATAAL